jgi:hypothetical protein
MASLFVVQESDFLPLAECATSPDGVTLNRRKHFVEVKFDKELTVDRKVTRHAVWYSSVAGVAGAKVVQFDKDGLKLVAEG